MWKIILNQFVACSIAGMAEERIVKTNVVISACVRMELCKRDVKTSNWDFVSASVYAIYLISKRTDFY